MRTKIGLILLLGSFSLMTKAQSTAESIVQANLDAYNQRNIDLFMKYIHPEVILYDYSSMKPIAEGSQAVRERYQTLFEKSPYLNSQLMGRTVLDNKIIDYEVISGRMGETQFVEMVVVYEVEDQLIKKMLVIRK